MTDRNWVEIGEALNNIEGNILKGLLEAQGFTVFLSQEGYQSAIGISGSFDAMTKILVPDDEVEEAEQVLKDYYAGKFEGE